MLEPQASPPARVSYRVQGDSNGGRGRLMRSQHQAPLRHSAHPCLKPQEFLKGLQIKPPGDRVQHKPTACLSDEKSNRQ